MGLISHIFKLFSEKKITIIFDLVSLCSLVAAILFVFIWMLISRRPLYIYNGREGAMQSNTRLLKKRLPRDRSKRYIYSTRISFWPLAEESSIRKEFRGLLTQKIESGIPVQRIWQLQGKDDLDRLESYLSIYKDYDNYSVKYFIGGYSYFPEILSFCGKGVSVSIPQRGDLRRVTTAFHFCGKKEIARWEGYFNILWEHCNTIKIGNNIYNEELKKAREILDESEVKNGK